MSETIYGRRKELADICRRARFDGDWGEYKPIAFESKSTDTQWYWLDLDDAYVIVFRGTEPNKVRDWMTDLMFRKKVLPYGNKHSKVRVHRGFIGAYKSVRGQVHGAVKQYVGAHKPIIVLGHSLGGALATLCAVDLQYCMQPTGALFGFGRVLKVYTFGSPRVGNASFSKSYIRRVPRTWRTWGWWDVVSKVPPRIFGFKHVSEGFGLKCRHDIKCYLRELSKAP